MRREVFEASFGRQFVGYSDFGQEKEVGLVQCRASTEVLVISIANVKMKSSEHAFCCL